MMRMMSTTIIALILFMGASAPVFAADAAAPEAATAAAVTPPEPAHIPENGQSDYRRPICSVSGRITAMQAIDKNPWTDGTPSTLTVTEVHLSLAITARQVQRNGNRPEDCAIPDSKTGVYKLCSPTQVKLGDHVMGTEGLATGSDNALGCLFDVVVIPAAPAPQ